MIKRSLKLNTPAVMKAPEKSVKKFKVINLVESHLPVPYVTKNGTKRFLNLRIQGKGGQVPPVIGEDSMHEGIHKLVKKGFIKLEEV